MILKRNLDLLRSYRKQMFFITREGSKERCISIKYLRFTCSKDVAENSFIHSLLAKQDNDKEKLFVIILNAKNKVIGYSLVSMGNLASSIVHPREVLKLVVLASAASIIIVHNNLPGNSELPNDDTEVTNRISRAALLWKLIFLTILFWVLKQMSLKDIITLDKKT